MTDYPPGAQAADKNILSAVSDLRGTVETGFDRVERRMDSMVTKDAHAADISRVDQRIDHINEKVDSRFDKVEKDMALGFAELRARDAERDDQFKAREDERDKKYSRRVGWTITAVGVGVSVMSLILSHFFS